MEYGKRQDLNLTGDCTGPGGLYNNVKIKGNIIIDGDIDCKEMKLDGTGGFYGDVKAKMITSNGTTNIKGSLDVDKMVKAGNLNIFSSVISKDIYVKGESIIQGNVSAEIGRIYGVLEIEGECNVESLLVKGHIKISSLLNAGTLDLQIHSKCKIKEIGGERITIKRGNDIILKKAFMSLFMNKDFYDGELETDSIEGDEIYIEYVKAKVVRGNHIKIGPGCEIGLIEYRSTLELDKASTVGSNIQL